MVTRLRQIIILRKLRISVKQIITILNTPEAVQVVDVFRENILQLGNEIIALSTVKKKLLHFVEEISKQTAIDLKLFEDEHLFSIISSLSFSNNQIKENKEALSMNDLNSASETLNQISDKDVRIIYLPPMTVATYRASGENCEEKAGEMIASFVLNENLFQLKPDLRQFGFDCSEGKIVVGEPSRSYEVWVSIPYELAVPSPFIKRTFIGGMYAAHVLRTWDFQDWRHLQQWVNQSDKYTNAWGSSRWTPADELSGQGFEEQLNYWSNAKNGFKMKDMQLDLLFPITEK